MPTSHESSGIFGEPIFSYSRAEAISDGVLIDVSAMAKQAGFALPVALTAAAWSDCVAWFDEDSARQTNQDQAGRLWDVLWCARNAAKSATGSRVAFKVWRIPRGGHTRIPAQAVLHAVIGPGDSGEPVITLMRHNED